MLWWSRDPLPKHLTNLLFNTSRFATHVIVDSIQNVQCFELDVHDDIIVSAHRDYQRVYMIVYLMICFQRFLQSLTLLTCMPFRGQELMIILVGSLLCSWKRTPLTSQLRNFVMPCRPFDTTSLFSVFLRSVMDVVLLPAWTIFSFVGRVALSSSTTMR